MSDSEPEQDPFRDIRPYNDAELPAVIDALVRNPELQQLLIRLRFPSLPRQFAGLLRPLLGIGLRRRFGGLRTVREFQNNIEAYMTRMLADTSDGLQVSGLEGLDPDGAYLFLSNHRDITLDPALVNYALHRAGRDTVRIAIGDNLLQRDYASDLMRLNKSFIVRRSVKGPRQVLAALRQLSRYIHHSVCQDRASVWIAQREGRAKDGWDRTEPALIKMLLMSLPKGGDVAAHLRQLRIVPVAISYELDPCDGAKARELYELEHSGHYDKAADEDLRSIGAGISGAKGEIHVAFGEALDGSVTDPDEVAAAIDRQVMAMYRVPPSSVFAWRAVFGELPAGYTVEDPGGQREQAFLARIDALPEAHRRYALQMYLNPIRNRIELFGQD